MLTFNFSLTNLSELLNVTISFIYSIIVAYSLFLLIEYNHNKINTVKCYKSVNNNTMYYI